MKKLCIVLILLFACSTIVSAQRNAMVPAKVRLETQLQQAMAEINRLNVVLNDVKAERNALILRAAELNKNAIEINNGIAKATNLLQKGYENGKLDYKELLDMGFVLNIDSTNVFQRPKDKSSK